MHYTPATLEFMYEQYLSHMVLMADCSKDFGKTLTQMELPYNTPVESLTAAIIGLWVAIHTVDPNTDQHEVHFLLLIL